MTTKLTYPWDPYGACIRCGSHDHHAPGCDWKKKRAGHLTTEHTAWCGACGHHETFAIRTKNGTRSAMLVRGWRHVRGRGWCCPACVARYGGSF